ncbi:hypothetical protein BG011_002384 [Mortierella polycephala]|uniref:Uncharacterized protein n=1 Tax=Mortierella polycephala TaxID=41804 RepID=A0A9P6PKL0_9FUNG|nr:hypothetical protein BG011_002384 [Mortierella polycephala]
MRYVAIADQIPGKTDVDKMLELISKLPVSLANKLRDKLHGINTLYELVSLAGRLSQSHESWTLFAPLQRTSAPSRHPPQHQRQDYSHSRAVAATPVQDDMKLGDELQHLVDVCLVRDLIGDGNVPHAESVDVFLLSASAFVRLRPERQLRWGFKNRARSMS